MKARAAITAELAADRTSRRYSSVRCFRDEPRIVGPGDQDSQDRGSTADQATYDRASVVGQQGHDVHRWHGSRLDRQFW
jgi:hypothetical protein